MRPLEGIRVLDLTRLLPGAYATLVLADLGAEVIKIEDPRGGDGMRSLDPVSFELLNRNKRSVTLDLRFARAAAVLEALAARSDVVVDSFRPATARRLGVDAETLRQRHPRLVCASISGFGADGPYANRAAHDINYQALAGLLDPPAVTGPLIADVGAAMQTATGIVAALFQRERSGVGSTVDISIHEAALAWSMCPTTADLHGPSYALYQTADGQWLALGALEPKFWGAFCDRVGCSDLRERHQPSLASSTRASAWQGAKGDERTRALNEVQAVMKTRTRDEWLAVFDDVDVCLTRVYTREEKFEDRHLAARGVLERIGGITYVTAPGIRVVPAPTLGADTDALLEASGIDDAERARLRADGII